ncbi:AlbA family DNA-binding domain-containing protein [Chryseobacterium culicis]|uniref:Putative DNA-binding domain-containing protein n=1 Tax=Chryseobacterium culicis TaxID=680127 RepID=A0A1H6IHP3_CHRCI|nr:ATP-binding protein [Chryseobacterium culicis]SEH48063.1 Putative DNA-binding domain-containing protein [Chryseobacterium culicis]
MINVNEISKIIGNPENQQLEYKAVLPPARSLAQLIASFANTDGGYVILGVHSVNGIINIVGLSEDFHANPVTNKALDLLSPRPRVDYQYISVKGSRLYVVKIQKSLVAVSYEGKIFSREATKTVLVNPDLKEVNISRLKSLSQAMNDLGNYKKSSTGAKSKFLDHYSGVFNIVDDLKSILYPESESIPTTNKEGKILMRILFSSCADNFEIYLTDLLYEIYLANPSTLKSGQQVSIKEVLDCADMEEFVLYWAKKKLAKLQRGSVKGFISDNSQIKDLQVLDENNQDEIEKILQIRHLYSHRNGVVDEKFLQFFSDSFELNDEHQFSINEMLNELSYLMKIVDLIDSAAVEKYQLATL